MALDSGQLNILTEEQFWPSVVSQVTTSTPFITELMKRKKVRGSGISFKWNLVVEKYPGQFYAGYELLDVAPKDPFKQAELQWVDHNIPIAISGDEIDQNSGKEARMDLLAEKMKVARDSVKYYIGKSLLQGQGSAYKEPDGIYNRTTAANSAIAENPLTGTYAGINRASADAGSGDFTNWFANHYLDAGSAAPTLKGFMSLIHDIEECGERPQMCLTSYNGLDVFYDLIKTYQRVPHAGMAEMGFTAWQFAGVPFVADKLAWRDSTNSESSFWLLNLDDIELRFIKGKFMHRTPWYTPKDQDAKVMHIRNKYCFGPKTPRLHGVYFNCTE